ncbi:MAG: hypothetical protein Q9174_003558 [Haloplaca sp. 1 TL-2023]
MSRQPLESDFSSHLALSIVKAPAHQSPVNVLILLHGLGDSKESFTTLATQMALPETTCISLQAPSPLPFDLNGFHWGDDITFNPSLGEMDYDTGFSKSSRVIKEEVIEKVLVQKCGYQARNILLFGFGQGGMAAIGTALTSGLELGGIVSIGGPKPSESIISSGGAKNQTPIIILGGSSNTLVTQSALSSLKQDFRYVEYVKWSKPGDSMPRNREEMMPIMKFLARRLQSRSGVPQDAVEVR